MNSSYFILLVQSSLNGVFVIFMNIQMEKPFQVLITMYENRNW